MITWIILGGTPIAAAVIIARLIRNSLPASLDDLYDIWGCDEADTPHHERETPPTLQTADTGDWVCAATVDHLPDGICGWPADNNPCPEHGNLTRGAL